MRHDDQATLERFQIIFQHVQRHDVEIVRRLVENQEVGVAHEDGQQVKSPAFAPAKFCHEGILQLVREKKIFKKLRCRHHPSVTEVDFLGNVFHDVDRAIVFLETDPVLFVITVNHGFSNFDGSAVRLDLAGNDIQEGRFSDPVFPDDTDLFSPYEFVGEIP